MKQYLDLIENVLANGSRQENRTGIDTISLPGAMLRFDLEEGFPAVTTKKLAFKTICGELVAFLNAKKNAADFRALGCGVWDQNANENSQWLNNPYRSGVDDLGEIYGVQWRKWPGYKKIKKSQTEKINDALQRGYSLVCEFVEQGVATVLLYKPIDQLKNCLDTIISNPSDRRIIFHAWNPAQLEEMALPPCHLLYQFLPNYSTKQISMCLYVRSNDLGLGAPFNIAEAALLLSIVGRLTGYQPKWLTYFIADAHIYVTHLAMLEEQLKRQPLPPPKLLISDRIPQYAQSGKYEPEWLGQLQPTDFLLEGYIHHPPLTAPMAV